MASPLFGGQPQRPAAGQSRLRSTERLAAAVSMLLLAMVLLCVGEAAVLFQRTELFSDVLDPPSTVTDDDFTYNNHWVFGILVAYLLGHVVTGIVFIRWQYRLARNSQAIAGPSGLGPGWAIGGWFVPLANCVLPAIQLFQSSRSVSLSVQGFHGSGPRRGSGLVALWMATFTAGNGILAAFSARPASFSILETATMDEVREARSTVYLGVVAFLVLMVAATAGIAMVQRLTGLQTARLAASSVEA